MEDWSHCSGFKDTIALQYPKVLDISQDSLDGTMWLGRNRNTHYLHKFGTQVIAVQISANSNEWSMFFCVLHLLLCSIDWSAVVVDEAHKIKNPNAQITQAMKDLECEVRCLCIPFPTSACFQIWRNTHRTFLFIVFLLLSWSGQNWPHWHHLTKQPGGAVVCHGLVCLTTFNHNI